MSWLRMGAIAGLFCAGAFAGGWLPVTDAERNLKQPRVEKDAGAEVLFWNVDIVQKLGIVPRTRYENYIRIKVFTRQGCETQGTARLPEYAVDVRGRTIKPNGTTVKPGKNAISVREAVNSRGLRIRTMLFVLPAVEPGDILEYRWSEWNGEPAEEYRWSAGWRSNEFDYSALVHLEFQRDIPVEQVRYLIRSVTPPWKYPVTLNAAMFHAELPPLVKGKEGYYTAPMDNVPAYAEEPLMPPPAQIRPWMLLHYTPVNKTTEEYWKDTGREIFEQAKRFLKPSEAVQRAAADAVAGATEPEEKLARLAGYCRTTVTNVAGSDITPRRRDQVAQNWSPGDILKHGVGTSSDVRMLFAAMASAAGFDARVAMLADRDDVVFSPGLIDIRLLPHEAIAVRLGEQWRFYDVSTRELPPGMLPWREEGVDALVSDPEQAVFAVSQFAGPEESATSRNGEFELQGDGTLEGAVRLAYTGQASARLREELRSLSAAQWEERIRDGVRKQFENAEVSGIKIEIVEDAEEPLTCSYRVKVPAYSQKTGDGMFLQPGFFERGQPAKFAAAERRYPVIFDYAWSEEDQVTIKLPEGYDLESQEALGPVDLGETGEYEVTVGAGAGRLAYQRRLVFGRGGRLAFPLPAYPQLKREFDAIHERDQRVLTLRKRLPEPLRASGRHRPSAPGR
jgi:hypothetical protein